jgi:signal transduction histidine kinase/AraC-like DNA-binding protein
MKKLIDILNTRLTNYLYYQGDTTEIIIQKKIWWLFNFIGTLSLLMIMLTMGSGGYGDIKDILDFIFFIVMPIALIGFHFYRRGIENWAFMSQFLLVIITSVKAYFMGGLLLAGAPIFVGLIGPVYALILPNKKRAYFIFALYMILMIGGTFIQDSQPEGMPLPLHVYGFFAGITQVFIVLLYFTTQVDKLKQREKQRMKELDEFKTRFYTNITHEFRTPLTIILGMAEQLGEGNDIRHQDNGMKEWRNGLSMITRNGIKLLNLTNQMLDLSKLEANAMPVNLIQDDIAVYLKYLVESFHSLAEGRNVDLNFSTNPDEIIMDFDPDKIQNIISNLISNAIKFTQKGGKVDIILSTEQTETNEHLIISISDNGKGIEKKHLPKVFDRYFQAEHNKDQLIEGTGLGLALTKELVTLLGGEISVKSELKRGSTFTIQLPIALRSKNKQILYTKEKIFRENLPVSPSISDNDVPLADGKPKDDRLLLLIVEDNEDVISYLQTILSDDYEIVVAINGLDGFEKAINHIPDLVISDVMMPIMDGFELCEKLKEDKRTSHIPVIILTARVDMESKVIGLKTGADAYLAKPFNKKELLVRIQKLIALRKSLQNRYQSWPEKEEFSPIGQEYLLEDTFMKDVYQILEENLGDDSFGITELCQSLGMSRSQVYRKFKALTDTTVHNFILKLRLSKARKLLLTSGLNVSEVALETGFKNLSHFSRLFSEAYGIPPSQLKKHTVK